MSMPPPNRAQPKLGPQQMKTYALVAPKQSHFRPASCQEVDCPHFLAGWITRVPVGSEMADYLSSGVHGRRGVETTGLDSAEREFTFYPGQPCFRASEHVVPLEREPLYIVRDGDWRKDLGRRRVHARGEDWVDEFATHQQGVADRKARG